MTIGLKQTFHRINFLFLICFKTLQLPRGIVSVVAVISLVVFTTSLAAQNYLTSTGQPSFGTPIPVELGSVDASSGNLHLSIPLASFSQRGASQPEAIALEYDSNIWNVDVYGSPTWQPYNTPASGAATYSGWYFSFQAFQGGQSNSGSETSQNCWTDYTWSDKEGSSHTFHINYTGASGCPSAADAFATDSSGYHMYINANAASNLWQSVYAPDGTIVYTELQDSQGRFIQTEDSNGNYLSGDYYHPYKIFDSLGRQVVDTSSLFRTLYSSPTSPAPVTVSTSQGSSTYNVTSAKISVNSAFGQAGVAEFSAPIYVVRSFTLPDNAQSTYYFSYDCDSSTGNPACSSPAGQSAYYGVLKSITLPTGGVVTYSYTKFNDAYGNKSQWVTSRSAAGGSWTYTPQVVSTCSAQQVNCQQQTTVQSPTEQTVYTFKLNNGAWPTSIVKKDIQGNILSTINNIWDMSQPCVLIGCHGANFVTLTSQQTSIPTAGGTLTKQVSYVYDSPQSGKPITVSEWNFSSGSGFSGIADRTTYTTYFSNLYNLTTGMSNTTSNRPLSVTVCNNSGSDSACPGGGSRVSQTLSAYDCYSGSGCSALSTIAGVTNHDDANFGGASVARGNVTSISNWVSGSLYLLSNYTYDTTGQVLSATDAAQNKTTYSYADNFFVDNGNGTAPVSYTPSQSTNAYPTTVTDAVGTQTGGYYWGSGKPAVATDYNRVSMSYHYQDGLDRQTEEIDAVGWKLATYSSALQSDFYMAVADAAPSTACVSCVHTQTNLNVWGQTASQIIVNNPMGSVEVDSFYDAMGHLSSQSHPYSGSNDPNHVFETYSYDALDRQISTMHPDGQTQQAAFGPTVGSLAGLTSQQGPASTYGNGYPQISEDESGNERQQWMDGFGRIIEVDEPSSSAGLASSPLVTNYLYDAAGRLTQVIQGSQTRSFSYDGLGRKISETTPEAGNTTYSYVKSGGGVCSGDPSKLCQRTDARGVVSTFTYDQGNRPTGVTYTIPSGQGVSPMLNVCTTATNGTPANVCYYYDQGGASLFAIGRLTQLIDGTGSENYGHDATGRVTQLSKTINGQTFNVGYQYNAGGDVTQFTYPSGRVVQNAYNQVGQLCQIAASATNCTPGSAYYAANFTYDAPGKLTGFNYGNGVTSAMYYSPDRMQLAYLSYTMGSSTYFNLQYSYQQNSRYSPSCSHGTTMNNGSIQCITDNVDTGRSVGYGYDQLLRMASANSCGSSSFPQWGLSESYDRYGNRLSQTATAGTLPQPNLNFNGNNQPIGFSFDASGNMTSQPYSNRMSYDGENQMTALQGSSTASYGYDGNGLRVIKSMQNGTTTVSIFSGSSVIAEYDNGASPSAPSREYVYNGAGDTTGLLAMFSGGATTYYHRDHLSVRLTTDGSGNIVSQQGHYPFGEQWYSAGTGGQWTFTTYNRDSESGLDYALARYYNSSTGTFCAADPVAGSPSDPQSWNRYPYSRNDPINVTDPSGQHWWNWVLEGIGIAAAIFQPEIDGFLAGLFAGPDDVSTALANLASGNVPELTNIPALIPRVATSAGGLAGAGEPVAAGASGIAGAAAASTTAAGLASDQRSPHQGQGPIDKVAAVNAAKSGLSKKCNSAFRNKIPHYTNSGFFNSLASASISQYPGGTPNIPAHTPGIDASTATETPGRPIRLFPNFYGNSYQYQLSVLVHEGIHHYSGWDDDMIFQKFFSSGLRHTNYGTADITDWVKNGCPPAK